MVYEETLNALKKCKRICQYFHTFFSFFGNRSCCETLWNHTEICFHYTSICSVNVMLPTLIGFNLIICIICFIYTTDNIPGNFLKNNNSLVAGRCGPNVWTLLKKMRPGESYRTLGIIMWVNIGSGKGLVHRATSHYLSHFWPRSMSPYGVNRHGELICLANNDWYIKNTIHVYINHMCICLCIYSPF